MAGLGNPQCGIEDGAECRLRADRAKAMLSYALV